MFKLEGDYIFKKVRDKYDQENYKLYIPVNFRHNLILQNHETLPSGHLGVFKTLSRLTQLYIWPGMREQVEDVVLSCLTCQQTKPRVTLPAGQMDSVKIPDLTHFSVIAIDTTDLHRTPCGFKHVLMIEDVFTKFIICVPLKAVTSSNIITALTDHLFLEHGIPVLSILLSDQATVFRSTEFQNMCSSYNIQSHFSPKYSLGQIVQNGSIE